MNKFSMARDCHRPVMDASVRLLRANTSYVSYSCRPGYKYDSGHLERSCDVNGTWSGLPPVCLVDSIMPKAYLVILIVGATVAVFLACIPYDFYRFRKRKKKVRDHQERLSLVTRIAPGHAKITLETVPADSCTAPHHPRRFGLKSLFSVFRFVGKAKHDLPATEILVTRQMSQNGDDVSGSADGAMAASSASTSMASTSASVSTMASTSANKNAEASDPNMDGAPGSLLSKIRSCRLSPENTGDVMDLCADGGQDTGGVYLGPNGSEGKYSYNTTETVFAEAFRPTKEAILVSIDEEDNNAVRALGNEGASDSKGNNSKKGGKSAWKRAHDASASLWPRRPKSHGDEGAVGGSNVPPQTSSFVDQNTGTNSDIFSEPATVEVTTLTETLTSPLKQTSADISDVTSTSAQDRLASQTAQNPSVMPTNNRPESKDRCQSAPGVLPRLPPPPKKMNSSTPSPDTPSDETGLCQGDPNVEQHRTFHFPSGSNSVAYHSMPSISDLP